MSADEEQDEKIAVGAVEGVEVGCASGGVEGGVPLNGMMKGD